MRRVFTGDTPAQARLVAGLLEEQGIDVVVEGESLTGARFALGTDESTLPGVFVRDEDVGRARSAIAATEHASAPTDDDEMPERTSLKWFKRFLLAWVLAGVAFLALAGVAMALWLFSRRS